MSRDAKLRLAYEMARSTLLNYEDERPAFDDPNLQDDYEAGLDLGLSGLSDALGA